MSVHLIANISNYTILRIARISEHLLTVLILIFIATLIDMVYVDDARNSFKGMKMCHMIADTDAELMEFAERLGLRPEWKHKDHFDLSQSFRDKAIQLGAVEISQYELAEKSFRLAGNEKAADRIRRYLDEERQGGLFK